MIINEYRGLIPRLKGLFEKICPRFYERYIKSLHVYLLDITRKSRIDAFIAKKVQAVPFPLFDHIHIETMSGCNNTCSFCPVSSNKDRRPVVRMSRELFADLIGQLRAVCFDGRIGLFSNNEPLLDERIYDFCRIAREALPKAKVYLSTNGLLLTVDRFKELMKYLDLLIIDNYDDRLRLIKSVKEVYEFCKEHDAYKGKVQIWMRKRNELLTNRAGQADNRQKLKKPLRSACALPFVQLVVRPDGKAGLCCMDALGLVTTGDTAKETLVDIWNAEALQRIRKDLARGRRYVEMCSRCDAGNM